MRIQFCVLVMVTGIQAAVSGQEFSELRGPYLGQMPPGMTPEIFAPGVISTDKKELNSVFSPAGTEFYYAKRTAEKGYTIWFTRIADDRWAEPQEAPFNSDYSDVDM